MGRGVQYGTGTQTALKADRMKVKVVETWREERRKFRRQIKLKMDVFNVYGTYISPRTNETKLIWKIVRERKREKREKWIGYIHTCEIRFADNKDNRRKTLEVAGKGQKLNL